MKFLEIWLTPIFNSHYVRNDNKYFRLKWRRLVGGEAANQPPPQQNVVKFCHSERSEESNFFTRTIQIKNG